MGVLLVLSVFTGMPGAWGCDPGCAPSGPSGPPPPGPPSCGGCCSGGASGEKDDCEEDKGEGNGCSQAGKPVELSSGRELFTETDLIVEGVFPIRIIRKYDSFSDYDSPVGYGWALTLDKRLYKYADGSIVIRNNCGIRDEYQFTGNTYQPSMGKSHQLTEQPDGSFVLAFANGARQFYDAQGKLSAIQNSEGHRLEMHYQDTTGDGVPDRLPLTGSSPYALNPAVSSVVALDYRLSRIEERLADGNLSGNAVDLQYDNTTGRLLSVTADDGRTVTYQHNLTASEFNGNLTHVFGMDGVNAVYEYNDRTTGGQLQDPHNITRIQRSGELAPYINTYDSQGRVATQRFGNDLYSFSYTPGVRTVVTHTINDNLNAPRSRSVTTLTFDEHGYAKTEEEALSTHNGSTFVLQVTYKLEQDRNSQGTVTKARWYERPPSTSTYTLLRTKSYDYDATLRKTFESVTMGGKTHTQTWGYNQGKKTFEQMEASDAPGDLFRTEYRYNYDSDNRPVTLSAIDRIKANGAKVTTNFAYEHNRLKTTTLPGGQNITNIYTGDKLTKTYFEAASGAESPYLKRQFGYDSRGNRNSITDARNNTTSLVYDNQGRVIQETNANNEQTYYTYTGTLLTRIEVGRTVVGQTVNEGQITDLFYTPEGWLERVERKPDSGANIFIARYTYDSTGNRLTQTQYRDGTPLTTTYRYDARGRMIRMTDPKNIVTEYAYDAFDNRTRVTEDVGGANRITAYQYDALDRLVQITQDVGGLNAVTTMTYDAAGNLLAVTDPENSTTTYTYDRLSRRTAVTQPLTQQVQSFYTARDQVDYVINARGHKIDYSYFPWGGLEKVEYFNTATDTTVQRTVTYTYDHNGNITNVIDDSIQATPLYTFTYDVLNRPDQTTVGYLPSSVTLNNDYDRYGNRNQFTLNDGSAQVHSFNYNKLNQLVGATLPGSQVFGFDYYNAAGPLRTLTYPSGITTDYQYEDNGPVKQILTRRSDGTTVIEQLDYTYDNMLNVETLTSANDGVYDYGYDPLDHLTQADYPSNVEAQGITDETFQYDKVGNRINTGHDYNANHQITQSPGVASYGFDLDGNMITKAGGFTYGYNKDNRLTSFTDVNNSANDASYRYDPFGRRISKTVNGTVTWFVWDGEQLIAEYNNTGTPTKRYAFLPFGYSPAQVEDSNGLYNVHYDHLHTPRFLTDSSQDTVWAQVQKVFGEMVVNENPDNDANSTEFNIRFPGQYFDEESGLYYNYFRDYDPSLGRYLQADPIGITYDFSNPQLQPAIDQGIPLTAGSGNSGLNHLYGYVDQNPLNFVDPFGLYGGQMDRFDRPPNSCELNCWNTWLVSNTQSTVVCTAASALVAPSGPGMLAVHVTCKASTVFTHFDLGKCLKQCKDDDECGNDDKDK